HERVDDTELLPQVQQALRERVLPQPRASAHRRRGPRTGDEALRSPGIHWSDRIDRCHPHQVGGLPAFVGEAVHGEGGLRDHRLPGDRGSH
ncbi:unnamed protein product, partial [Pylaiella littoralis]